MYLHNKINTKTFFFLLLSKWTDKCVLYYYNELYKFHDSIFDYNNRVKYSIVVLSKICYDIHSYPCWLAAQYSICPF